MQVVLGTLVTVLVLELFSTGNGANIQDQNRGYIIDLPSQMTTRGGSWSGNDNYKRQVSGTKNAPNKPVYIFPAIKYRPNYFVYKDKQTNVNMGLPREKYFQYDLGQINRNSTLLVALRPKFVMTPNLDLNANKYEKPYPHPFLPHNRTQPQLPAVYYHPQSKGYHPTPRRVRYQIDQIPITGYNTPLSGHIKPLFGHRQPSLGNGYHPPNYRQPVHQKGVRLSQGYGPRSPLYKGAASFPHPGIIPLRVYRKVGPSRHPVAAPLSSSHPVLAPSSPYSEVAPPPHPNVAPPPHPNVAPPPHLNVAPPPHPNVAPPLHPNVAPPPSSHSSVTQPSKQHEARSRLLPHPGVARAPPPPHPGVVLPPPPPGETPLIGVVPHSVIDPSSPHSEWTLPHLREAPPPHLGKAPPPRHIDVAPPPHLKEDPPPPHHADVAPLSQFIAVQPPLQHSGVAPPPHLKAVLPLPPHSNEAPPPLSHSGVAPPPHLKAVLPPPPPPHSGLPSPRPQQTREDPPLSHPGVAAPQYLGVERSPSHLRGVATPTHSSYLKKIEYNTDSNAANYIYRNVPTTFWKTHFPLNKVKRSIGDGEDYLHDLEFEELEYEDEENDDNENYIDDHTHSQDVNGHDSHADNDHDSNHNHNNDSTDSYKRKKRWVSDNSQNNGDCQDCEMSNENGEEDGYNVDPWNNGDSGESSQTDTWNNDDNNDDYTWNNDDNNDDYTWNNDDNDDDYTWNNDGNNDDYTWNNDDDNDDYTWNNDESEDGETDTDDVSYPTVPKPHPPPPQPGPIRQPAYPRRPPPPRRVSQQPIPRPNPHAPNRHRPQAWPGSGPSENIHPRPNLRPNPHPSRPERPHGPQPQTHNYPSHQLPIPPAPPRHPKSPPYPSEHLQYDWYYEDC